MQMLNETQVNPKEMYCLKCVEYPDYIVRFRESGTFWLCNQNVDAAVFDKKGAAETKEILEASGVFIDTGSYDNFVPVRVSLQIVPLLDIPVLKHVVSFIKTGINNTAQDYEHE